MTSLSATLVLLFVGVAYCVRPVEHSNHGFEAKNAESDFLLDGNITPSLYQLTLTTAIEKFNSSDESSFQFIGEIDITVKADDNFTSIVLHRADSITIKYATLISITDGANSKLNFDTYNQTLNQLTLTTEEEQISGEYIISLIYTGKHGDDMRGFYRSTYINEKNKERYLITTQFEAADARRAFPCFDEPSMKALYDITIKVNKDFITNEGYSVLSNMPLEDGSPTEADGFQVYKFKRSAQPISSYLVAFIVSDFVSTKAATFGENQQFTTHGRKSYIENGDGLLSQYAGSAVMDIMSGFTSFKFPYPKLDQVGIPDFAAGAMENWGLVTYRERILFFNESRHPTSVKQNIVTTTAHELGHQWFGDTVTLHWWSDIWLNEGFATYCEYHATDKIATKDLNTSTWQMIGQMVIDELQAGAFAIDGLENTRPLTSVVYSPGDIDANFDDISYSKGGSVIRMWNHILGDELFKAGIAKYIENNKYQVGTPESLLASFDEVLPTDHELQGRIAELFSSWHTNAGYPVLKVERTDGGINVTQERFFWSANATTSDWFVPISYTTNNEANFSSTTPDFHLETNDTTEFNVPAYEWIILNIQQTGYYRVLYDSENWEKLIDLLQNKHETVHIINRAQLIDDAFSLARSTNEYLTYQTPFNISLYLKNERELVPWKAALNNFNYLYVKLANTPALNKLQILMLEGVKDAFDDLTLNVAVKDGHTRRILRSNIASWACKLGYDNCINAANELFPRVIINGTAGVEPDVIAAVLCTGIRNGDADAWNAIWDKFASTTDNYEQTVYLTALGCSQDTEILNKFLSKTLTSEIRKQDASACFSSVHSGNPENIAVAVKFLTENLEAVANSYGGLNPLGSVIMTLASKLSTKEDIQSMTALKKKIDESKDEVVQRARTSAEAALATVNSNNAWLESKQDSINSWLDTKYPSSAVSASVTIFALLLPIIVSILNRY